jgi:hypothetical protein
MGCLAQRLRLRAWAEPDFAGWQIRSKPEATTGAGRTHRPQGAKRSSRVQQFGRMGARSQIWRSQSMCFFGAAYVLAVRAPAAALPVLCQYHQHRCDTPPEPFKSMAIKEERIASSNPIENLAIATFWVPSGDMSSDGGTPPKLKTKTRQQSPPPSTKFFC